MHTCVNSNVKMYFDTDLSFTNISIIQKKTNIILLYKIREEIFRSQISVCVNVQLYAYTGIFKARKQVETFRKKKKSPLFFLQEKDSWYLEYYSQFGVLSKSKTSINWSKFDSGPPVCWGSCSIYTVNRDWGYCSCSAWRKKKNSFFGVFRET